MAEPPDNVLSYAPKRKRFGEWRMSRRTWITLGIMGVICFVGFSIVFGPTSGQIRLDTGDLRYCWWGIPVKYRPMPEPLRSKILALASKSPAVPLKWVTCVTYPLPSSNNTDYMCADFYWSIAIWSDEDPKIARWALEDVVDYIPGMLTHGGLPNASGVLSTFVVDRHARKVNADWRDDEEIKNYCGVHGYVPPLSTLPASRP